MKAVILKGKNIVEIEEIPKPEVKPRTLLLKVLYCSICGSDVERVYSPLWDFVSPVQRSSMVGSILGHEYVARVEAVGPGVKGWSVGDRAVDVQTSCGNCFYCRRGMNELCMHGIVRGYPYGSASTISSPPRWGAMTEYVLRSVDDRLKVPDIVSDEEAAMTEPLATGVTAALNAGVKLGDSVAVIGVGHIGMMVMAAAKAAGAAPVIAIDKNQKRLEVAKKIGANIIINPDKTDVIKEAVAITEAGPDIVFVCVGAAVPGVLESAFDMVRYHGRIIIVGHPAPALLDPTVWMTKEVRIEGTVHMGEAMVPAMKLLEYGQVNVRPTITEIVPLTEAQRGFDSLHTAKNIAVLLKP